MKTYFTYSDFSEYKLKGDQTYYVSDMVKKAAGKPSSFTVWSDDQLDRLYENGTIDDINFKVVLAKSAENGYSYNTDTAKKAGMSVGDAKKARLL